MKKQIYLLSAFLLVISTSLALSHQSSTTYSLKAQIKSESCSGKHPKFEIAGFTRLRVTSNGPGHDKITVYYSDKNKAPMICIVEHSLSVAFVVRGRLYDEQAFKSLIKRTKQANFEIEKEFKPGSEPLAIDSRNYGAVLTV